MPTLECALFSQQGIFSLFSFSKTFTWRSIFKYYIRAPPKQYGINGPQGLDASVHFQKRVRERSVQKLISFCHRKSTGCFSSPPPPATTLGGNISCGGSDYCPLCRGGKLASFEISLWLKKAPIADFSSRPTRPLLMSPCGLSPVVALNSELPPPPDGGIGQLLGCSLHSSKDTRTVYLFAVNATDRCISYTNGG